MVSFKDIQRRVAESSQDVERKIRRLLPVSKGGDVEGRTIQEQIEDNLSGLMPETTRVITDQQPIPTSKITSRKEGATSSRRRPGSGGSRGSKQKVNTMVTEVEALAEVINNPEITIDERLRNLINSPIVGMDPVTGQIGRIDEGFGDSRNLASIDAMQLSRQFERQNVLPRKKKRKVSKYQKEFGKQLKKLKKKHPRTPVTKLMKRAHAATRKAMK